MSDSNPKPPESVPKYIAEGIPKQDIDTLHDIACWVDELIDLYSRPIDLSEIETEEDEIVDIPSKSSGSKGTIVIKKVKCGKDCNGCPHGPYKYRAYRQKGKVKWDYIGKVER